MAKTELLCSDDPITNVLSRQLAWESSIRGHSVEEVDSVALVRRVRYDLGIIDKGTGNDVWYKDNKQNITDLTRQKNANAYNWRFINLPSHLGVRSLAWDAFVNNVNKNAGDKLVSFDILFNAPSVPPLQIFLGAGKPTQDEYIQRRAIYLLLHNENDIINLYVGKADNAQERMEQHLRGKNPYYYFLAFPKESEAQFNGDVRDATESLMIAFWSEIAYISNNNMGTTIKPLSAADFYMSILLTSAISAAYVYTAKKLADEMSEELGIKNTKIQIPFKGRYIKGWPNGYLDTDPNPVIDAV